MCPFKKRLRESWWKPETVTTGEQIIFQHKRDPFVLGSRPPLDHDPAMSNIFQMNIRLNKDFVKANKNQK